MLIVLMSAVSYVIYKVINFDKNVWSLLTHEPDRSYPQGGVHVRTVSPANPRPPLGSAGFYRASRAIQLPRLRDTRVSTLRDLSARLTYGYETAQHR